MNTLNSRTNPGRSIVRNLAAAWRWSVGSRLWLLLFALLFALQGAFAAHPLLAIDRDARIRALKATVQLLVPDNSGKLMATGSGTIMDAESGYILSNFHVIGDRERGRLYNRDGIVIVGIMPTDLKGAPMLKYLAQFVNGDPQLDLSLFKIVALYDNQRAPLPKNLGLTAIPIGDSDKLLTGDELAVFGYPGLGGSTVTYTDGKVSGFLDDDNDKVYEWIKTDAEMNPGNSGGLATNEMGEFIGVPSAGVSDAQVAGKISLIRTGNLALQFYDGSLMGQRRSVGGPKGAPKVTVPDQAEVVAVEFGTAVNRQGEIMRPGVRFSSGIKDLYAAFRYNGFTDGGTFNYIWYLNGEEVINESQEWTSGRSGSNWVNLSNERGLDDGFYELELRLDGAQLYRSGVTVGEQASAASASFGKITFAEGVTPNGEPSKPGDTFVDVKAIYAFFAVAGMKDGVVWSTKWYYEGEHVAGEETAWEFGDIANHYVWLEHPDGLPKGEYKLEIYIEGQLRQRSEFEIGERPRRKARGVNVIGTVTDADNKRKVVGGALVVFLNPGTSVQEWVSANYDENMIFARGTTDRRGEYQLDAKVLPGESYSVVVYHESYDLVSADDYQIPEDAEDPYVLDATMQQR